jgi:glycosyltransferase involved in cell wall biosynthesis
MRLGIIAYASNTGLGNQTWELYRNMKPAKTLLVNLETLNRMPVKLDRFPDSRVTNGRPTDQDIDWLTDDVDAIFVCETALNFDLFARARYKRVTTIQQYNYEFLDYFSYPEWPRPTVWAAPTCWNIDIITQLSKDLDIRLMDWPVPVNREGIPFRNIEQCHTFVHIIGRPAIHDRNGTITFLEAAHKIGNRARYRIYLQPPDDIKAIEYFEPVKQKIEQYRGDLRIEVVNGVENYADMYASGDVLVLPRRYGGLCLPMQEALSAGMPVIMTNISPNDQTLPQEWLVPASKIKEFYPRPRVDVYGSDPNMLAFKMLEFLNSSDYMKQANVKANEIADSISWERMKPIYDNLLDEACRK